VSGTTHNASRKRTDAMDVQRIKELLIALRDSCYEGVDGTWDCSTDEGKESFIPMADDCEEIASLLGIELPEHDLLDFDNLNIRETFESNVQGTSLWRVLNEEDEEVFLPPS